MRIPFQTSPWIIIGLSLVLMTFTAGLGVLKHNRDQARTANMLCEKGAAVIQAVETAAFHSPGIYSERIQNVGRTMEAVVHHEGILWMTLALPDGRILLRSPRDAGPPAPPSPDTISLSGGKEAIKWRLIRPKNRPPYFEVLRQVSPPKDQKPALMLSIALETEHIEQALADDRNHNIIMVCIVVALGFSGIFAMFWARRDARTRALLEQAQKLALIGSLAAGVAHEVRNPLSSIKGYATYFATLFAPDSEDQKAAGHMAEEVERVNRVITELLSFARPADLKCQAVDLENMITHSLAVIDREARAAGVSIESPDPQFPIYIEVDPDRLNQVLLNLYINAIQAMPQGGHLTISTRARSRDAEIRIQDTGCGIPREDLHRIFDPYFTGKADGTGLGLAVSKKIILNHGGTIRAKSTVGEGTCFILTLPLEQEERSTS